MDIRYFIFIVLFLLCLAIRSSYELLKEAGKVDPESKLVFGFIFAAMCTLWVSWFALCPLDPYQVSLPDAMRWSGLALFVVGMILALGALLQLRGLENIDHLITTGLFKKLRHPMYTGFGLWILGWSIYHGATASLAVGLIGIANVLFWRRLEDTRLSLKYGDVYKQYLLTTWF